MNWIQENKFLTGYFVVVLIATGVLGFLLFTGKSQYDESIENFNRQSTELHRLKALPLFPNDEHLEKLQAQKAEKKAKIEELQQSLATAKLPVEAMTPEQFQDKLRASVTDFEKKANDAGMVYPKGFYMGFDRYQSIPPKPAAAPLLGRDLKAMEMVLDDLPSHGIVELKSVWREDLPEEEVGPARNDQARGPVSVQAAGKGPLGRPEKSLLERHSFEVNFLAPKGGTQFILNDIVGNKFQCMVPRLIVIKNEKEKGPPREPAISAVPPPPANPLPTGPGAMGAPGGRAGAASAPVAPSPSPVEDESHSFIVGDEKVDTTLRVEIVDVADLPASKPVAAK